MSDLLVTDVVTGGASGTATCPLRGKLKALWRAVQGKGDPRASLSLRSRLALPGGGGQL